MNHYIKLFFITSFFISSCGITTGIGDFTNSPEDTEETEYETSEGETWNPFSERTTVDEEEYEDGDVVPEIEIETNIPELADGHESALTITGMVDGETIDESWDFKLPSPVRECSGNSTVLTNGAINTLTNSTAGIDLAFDSDWGVGKCAMSSSDWHFRFTIGNPNRG